MVAKPYIIGPGLKVVSSEEMMCSGVSIDWLIDIKNTQI
jgi:hypothetical protein